MRYDVIVVGAGPSGSTAARECASRGMSVLLLEKSEFPRDKPCGGGVIHGVIHDVLSLLPFELTPVIERIVSASLFSYGPFPRFTRKLRDPLFVTQRVTLDSFLDVAADGPMPRLGLEMFPPEGRSDMDNWLTSGRNTWRLIVERLETDGWGLPDRVRGVLDFSGLDKV